MHLQHLDTLRLIVELGSFTRAAQAQNVTQSTVSMRIAQLEEQFGTRLLDRRGRSIELTAAGEKVFTYANDIHLLSAALQKELAQPETVAGTIRIGIAELLAPVWMPELVGRLNQQFPNIQVEIEVGLSNPMYDLVRRQSLDVCFHPVADQLGPDLELTLLGNVQYAFLASPRLKLGERRLRPADLNNVPIITFGPDSVISEIQARWLAQAPATTFDFKSSNSMEVAAGLVRSGLGISFLPAKPYEPDIQCGTMQLLTVVKPPPRVPFYAIRTKANQTSVTRKTIEIALSIEGLSR